LCEIQHSSANIGFRFAEERTRGVEQILKFTEKYCGHFPFKFRFSFKKLTGPERQKLNKEIKKRRPILDWVKDSTEVNEILFTNHEKNPA